MKNFCVCLSIVLLGSLAIITRPALAQQTHTRSITLCAVDMTFAEMAGLVERIREFHGKANRDSPRDYLREVLTLQDGILTLESTGDFSLETLEKGPEIATRSSYRMSMRETVPISRVDLDFRDNEREVTISGTDRDLVYGLPLLISQEIERLACSFGGRDTRLHFGLSIFVLAQIFAWVPFILTRLLKDSTFGPRASVLAVSISAGLFVVVFALPWADWLPGTAIRLQPSSTWDQINPFVAVLSLLLSFVAVSLSALRFFARGKARSND